MAGRGLAIGSFSSVSVHIATPRAIVSYLETVKGHAIAPEFPFDLPALLQPQRLPMARVEELWKHMLAQCGYRFSPACLAAQIGFGTYGAFDYLLACSENLLWAFQKMQRYSKLANEAFLFAVEPHVRGLAIEIHPMPGVQMPDGYVEFIFSILIRRARLISGGRMRIERFDLQENRLFSAREFFGTASCFTGCNVNRIIIGKDSLVSPFASSDSALAETLETHLQKILNNGTAADAFTYQIEQALHMGLATGDVHLHTIARQLGLSERTLERRLRERGTNFRDVLDRIRFQKMQLLLSSMPFDVDELTRLLCYSEIRSFYRAFKRWYGQSPRFILTSHSLSCTQLSEKVSF